MNELWPTSSIVMRRLRLLHRDETNGQVSLELVSTPPQYWGCHVQVFSFSPLTVLAVCFVFLSYCILYFKTEEVDVNMFLFHAGLQEEEKLSRAASPVNRCHMEEKKKTPAYPRRDLNPRQPIVIAWMKGANDCALGLPMPINYKWPDNLSGTKGYLRASERWIGYWHWMFTWKVR